MNTLETARHLTANIKNIDTKPHLRPVLEAELLKLGHDVDVVKESLDKALKLAPKHAEAHTALGLYHAEIINKVGGLIGGMTYGAKAATGEQHLKTALKLTPGSPIAHIEFGNGLLLLYGDKREDEAAEAYEKATQLMQRDAMDRLDIEFAKSQLE